MAIAALVISIIAFLIAYFKKGAGSYPSERSLHILVNEREKLQDKREELRRMKYDAAYPPVKVNTHVLVLESAELTAFCGIVLDRDDSSYLIRSYDKNIKQYFLRHQFQTMADPTTPTYLNSQDV